jgi:hypothetical protein
MSEVSTSRKASTIAGELLDSLEISNNTLFIDGDSAPRRLMSGALRDILDPVIGVFWPKYAVLMRQSVVAGDV